MRYSLVLDALERVDSRVMKSEMKPSAIESISKYINVIKKYLKVSEEEALMFSVVFSFQVCNELCDYSNISRYLSVSPYRALYYKSVINKLVEKNICELEVSKRRTLLRGTLFKINQLVFNAVVQCKPFPKEELERIPNSFDWLEQKINFINKRLEAIEAVYLDEEIEKELGKKSEGGLSDFISNLDIEPMHKMLMIYTIWHALIKRETMYPFEFYEKTPKSKFYGHTEMKKLVSEVHPLIKERILTTEPAVFSNDVEVSIHEDFKEKLRDFGIEFQEAINKKKAMLNYTHDKIKDKKLFYNKNEREQIKKITHLLEQSNFETLQARMEEKGLSKGIAALFFGSPGTGKTESVMQLARTTGRDIIQVDISNSKSMWLGQSEKKIKKVFTDYKEACQQTEISPILLINEADAILSRRKSNMSSNVAQTENAIQNILLEEIENLDGILIATTNLEENLDTAFDRRFLFKVKFEKPESKQRYQIWKGKVKGISSKALMEIAEQFDLSGGQIDNVMRKTEMDYILDGTKPNKKSIIKYCEEELSLTKGGHKKIGF